MRGDELAQNRHPSPGNDAITIRQREVLREVALHGTYVAAASCLGISVQTVKNHMKDAYERLGVHNNISAYIALDWLRVP